MTRDSFTSNQKTYFSWEVEQIYLFIYLFFDFLCVDRIKSRSYKISKEYIFPFILLMAWAACIPITYGWYILMHHCNERASLYYFHWQFDTKPTFTAWIALEKGRVHRILKKVVTKTSFPRIAGKKNGCVEWKVSRQRTVLNLIVDVRPKRNIKNTQLKVHPALKELVL